MSSEPGEEGEQGEAWGGPPVAAPRLETEWAPNGSKGLYGAAVPLPILRILRIFGYLGALAFATHTRRLCCHANLQEPIGT